MKPFDQDAEEQKDKEEKEDGELASEEAARAKIVKPGYHPTSKEIAEHMVNHLPYRAWCKHCIKGKAKGLPHRKIGEEMKSEETVPVVSFDYMFMDDDQKEHEEKGMPILVAKDRKKKVVRARVVPQKGKHWYSIKIASGIVDSLGYKRVVLKSDQEPAIMSLKEGVKNESGAEIVLEESPGYDSKGNGEIEQAVQLVQGQFRAMKDALESRYGVRFDGDHNCIPWLVAHASDSITRYHVYSDGRTGYQNWKGRPFNKECVEFGECIMYKPPGNTGKDKFENRWEEGVWLGVVDRTNEVIVGTSEGVIKVKDVKRVEFGQGRGRAAHGG